jgi:ssDNA-binding Zn-finger/Zn-ribbon topoisomerase 1
LYLAQPLIDLVSEHNLLMALPRDLPTLQSSSTKNYTRTDNIFASETLIERLVGCNTAPDRRPPKTDHLPTHFSVKAETPRAREAKCYNFKEGNWDKYSKELERRLAALPGCARIHTQEELDSRVERLTQAIWEAVKESVPMLIISHHSKRWWRKGLTNLRRESRQLANAAYKCRDSPDHPVHADYRRARNIYAQAIKDSKRTHWEDFLEGLCQSPMRRKQDKVPKAMSRPL